MKKKNQGGRGKKKRILTKIEKYSGGDWFRYCVSWALFNKPELSISKNPRKVKTNMNCKSSKKDERQNRSTKIISN